MDMNKFKQIKINWEQVFVFSLAILMWVLVFSCIALYLLWLSGVVGMMIGHPFISSNKLAYPPMMFGIAGMTILFVLIVMSLIKWFKDALKNKHT